MVAALFDIEGTLFTNPMGKGLTQYVYSHGRVLQAAAYFASLMPLYQFSKLGLINRERFNTTAIARMAWLIRGYGLREADAAFDWVADGFLLPSGRKSVLACWEKHLRSGHLLLIASGGLTPIVDRIGARLRAAGTAGTDTQVVNGRYTGRVSSPVVIGREKADRTLKLVSRLGVEVDWQESSAYADSFHDLPFLELTGHPVAVHPDAALKRVARDRGWRILDGG
ncbi:MAG: haloacid dehalogenase-like hydrolase [Anaerolineales bacterium]|nr:haloacid dehalogenase-like hydrolase [Anaerolineales bacterium]